MNYSYHGKKRNHSIVLWTALGIITVAVLIGLFALHAGNKPDYSEGAYADFMNRIGESSGELRFKLGYIDDDDIPELMFCYGDWHAAGIYICSLNQDSGAVEGLGEYSSFGTFDYYKQRNIIVSQYGGMGFWYHIYEQSGASGEGKILAIEGTWGTEEGIRYYWQSAYEGTQDDFEQNFKSCSVSETEYTKNLEEFLASLTDATAVTVNYDDMIEFTSENLHAAFQELN